MADYISVKTYGATGNGTTNDAAYIQAAINAANEGDVVLFPSGTYFITSQININKRITLRGGKCKIKMTSNTGFSVTSEDSVIEGFVFEGNRSSSNTAIVLNNNKIVVRDCDFYHVGLGINVAGGVWHTISRVRCRNIVVGCIEIGNTVGTVVEDLRNDTDVATYPQPQYGIYVWGEGCNISDIDLIHSGKCLLLKTVPTRSITWLFLNSCSFDTSEYGVYIQNSYSSQSIRGIMFDQCWFASMATAGVCIDSPYTVNGVTLSSCTIVNNSKEGIVINGSVDNVDINGCTFSGNSIAEPSLHHNIYSNISGKKYIRNNQFSNWGGLLSTVGKDILRAEQDGVCIIEGNIALGGSGGGYISGSSVAAQFGKNYGNLPSI